MSDIIVERHDRIVWLRLNRPERLNSYDRNTIDEIIAAFREHVDAGAVVITGQGRAFCAGGYLANLAEADFYELRTMFYGSLELFGRHPQCAHAGDRGGERPRLREAATSWWWPATSPSPQNRPSWARPGSRWAAPRCWEAPTCWP